MTKEEKFVVDPLQKYFLDQKRSGAKWWIKDRPKFGTAATGWDLQVERHGQVLLIEAKYIRGAFATSMAGLIISPLSLRREVMKRKGLKKSWSGVICWSIGSGYGGSKQISNEKYIPDPFRLYRKESRVLEILFQNFKSKIYFLC